VTPAELTFVRLIGRFWSIIRGVCVYLQRLNTMQKNNKLPNHTILNFRKCYRVDLHVLRLFFVYGIQYKCQLRNYVFTFLPYTRNA